MASSSDDVVENYGPLFLHDLLGIMRKRQSFTLRCMDHSTGDVRVAAVRLHWAVKHRSHFDLFDVDTEEVVWYLEPADWRREIQPAVEGSPFPVLLVIPSEDSMRYQDVIQYLGEVMRLSTKRVWRDSPNLPVMLNGFDNRDAYAYQVVQTIYEYDGLEKENRNCFYVG